MTRYRRRHNQPPTLESLRAELRGLRVAFAAILIAIVAVGVVVAVLLAGRAPRQKYVQDQLRTLTCLAVLRLPDTNPTARDLRDAYHCPPYRPLPKPHRAGQGASSVPPAAARPRLAPSLHTGPIPVSASSTSEASRPRRDVQAAPATVVRTARATSTVTAPAPAPSTVTASPSGPLAPLCNLAADLRLC